MTRPVPNLEQIGNNEAVALAFAVSDRDMLRETHRLAVEIIKKLDCIERRVADIELQHEQHRGALRVMKALWGGAVVAVMAYLAYRQGNH